ncbi:hypothetical protein O3P69_018611 [Scylla paramamosain]|uniref:Uncharacterized protein n=1 Tax=Scylla paramamosain TaxID=85552 RepID=A0AAW0T2B4_SCYPA
MFAVNAPQTCLCACLTPGLVWEHGGNQWPAVVVWVLEADRWPMEGLQQLKQNDEGEDGGETFVHPSNPTKALYGLSQLQEPSSHGQPDVNQLGKNGNPDDDSVHPSISELSRPLWRTS